jgi:two-component system, OmpR family, sensor kinase
MPFRFDRLARLGLRWRLAGVVVLLILACMGIAFIAVYHGTGTQVRSQIDSEIAGDASDLAHNLKLAHARTPKQISQAASRYIASLPFAASSTLLFALVPGAPTAANRPELFHPEAPDNGETAAEQSQENRLATQLSTIRTGYATLVLPDIGDLRVLRRAVALPGLQERSSRVVIGVGESLATVSRAQRGVARAFILAGLLALAGALLGAYLIGTLLSRPLRRMASVAARVDAGDLHPRIRDPAGHGEEVRVLAEAFNHMLDRLTAAFAGQRAFVADASHELRTPLTVIAGQIEVLAEQKHPSSEEVRRVQKLVQAEIARTSRLVDDLLLLAKAEQDHFLRIEPIDLKAFIGELWDGISALADRRFELDPIPAGTLLADPDRLAQALRNMLTNAIAHTTPPDGLVRLSARSAPGGQIELAVQDDGPGIPAAEREHVFDRFHRIDTARNRASGGTGLGLAIVRAIAQAHEGRVSAGEAHGGGARVTLQLPRFTPARRAPSPATAMPTRTQSG